MSYNGSGTFNVNTAGQPVVTGTVISSTAFNALTADLATGLSTAITKDGQTTTTARITFAQGISSTLVTDATSATTGSIITAGGISCQKALWVGTTSRHVGATQFDAAITYGGVTLSNSVTGTGSMVLNTAPTFTAAAGGNPSLIVYGTNYSLINIRKGADAQSAGVQLLNAANAQQWFVGISENTNDHVWYSGSEKMRLTTSGRLQVGTTAGTGYINMANAGGGLHQINSSGGDQEILNLFSDNNLYFSAPSNIIIRPGGSGEKARFDTSGNFGIGTTSFGSNNRFIVSGRSFLSGGTMDPGGDATNGLAAGYDTTSDYAYLWAGRSGVANKPFVISGYPLQFYIASTEVARIDTSGCLIVGATSTTNRDTTAAVYLGPSVIQSNRTSGATCDFGRLSTDGDIVVFRKDGTVQGSISVSGSTISYNAFAGSHWSQLEDGERTEILRGTVMEAMDELCVWPDEENERLPKCKISDTAGSKNVYGVFMAWDNDWTVTNDLHVMAVGSFICRIASNSVVQIGDLLESNGDGTARVQADDVIRSSTLGKVVSAEQVYKYDDGSYCVPAVLYCG